LSYTRPKATLRLCHSLCARVKDHRAREDIRATVDPRIDSRSALQPTIDTDPRIAFVYCRHRQTAVGAAVD